MRPPDSSRTDRGVVKTVEDFINSFLIRESRREMKKRRSVFVRALPSWRFPKTVFVEVVLMIRTVEAIIDQNGNVHLLEAIKLTAVKRAS